MKSYEFKNSALHIESKLPFLWREISKTLLELSLEKISYEDAKDYVLNEVIKQRISSMSTIPILQSALNKGFEVTPTLLIEERVPYTKPFNRQYTLGTGEGSEIVYSISSTQDSKNAKEIQRDKWASNLMMQKLGLPIPKWEVLDTEDEIEKVWDKYEKPVVIKPTGLIGGKGVSTGINSIDEAKKAYRWALEKLEEKGRLGWQRKIMVQEQIGGEDYRLLVIDGTLEIATKRIPAFITGDGKKNIKELIEETNKDPRRDISNPSHILKPIIIDEPLLDFLKEQNLSLEYLPKKDEKVVVRKVASMSQGGITEDFTDQVSPEIKYIVESISKSVHAFVIGVDVLCKDISKPLTKENGGILEINTMPEAYLNLYPVIGEQRGYVADTYVKKLLKNNNCKKIVVVGQFTKDIPTLLKQKTFFKSYLNDEDNVGEYKEGDLLLNSLKVNSGLEKDKAVEGLKVNALLDAIVIHHRDWDDVEQTGLGFDNIDMLIVSKKLTEDEKYKIVKKYKRKGFIEKIKII
jgi:D-alanine-D-alanine ligase-like ATP-grasp enzyme